MRIDLEKDPRTGSSWRLNTVRVDEVLKGPEASEIIFAERADSVPPIPVEPTNSDSRALIFLSPGTQSAYPDASNYPWVLAGHITLQVDPGVAPSALAITNGFEKITDPNRLLVVAREICTQNLSVRTLKPDSLTFISDEKGDEVIVPLNERTDAYAIAWSTSSSIHRRLVAIDLLAQRKTPSAIQALQSILSHDPATVEVGTGPARSRYYCVRAEVASRLEEMGVPFSPARLEEPLVGYSSVPHLAVYSVLAILLALCVVLLITIAAPRGRKLAWAFLCAWAMAVVAITAAWIASGHWEQELVINGINRHRFDSRDGVLQYTLVHDWLDPGPSLLASFDRAELRQPLPLASTEDPLMIIADWHVQFRHRSIKLPYENLTSSRGGADFSVSRGTVEDTFGIQRRFERLRISYSYPIALLALFPVVVVVRLFLRRVRQREHSRRGLCPGCGYDMRATPDRCPECGRTGETLQAS